MKPQKLVLIHVIYIFLLVLTSLQKKVNCIHGYHKKYMNQINSGNDRGEYSSIPFDFLPQPYYFQV